MNKGPAFWAAVACLGLGAAGLLFTAAAPVPAPFPPVKAAAAAPQLPSVWPAAILLAALAGAALLARGRKRAAEARALKVLGSVALSQNQRLVTVKFGGRVLLLGQSPSRLTALAGTSSPEEIRLLEPEQGDEPEEQGALARVLKLFPLPRGRAASLWALPLALGLLALAAPASAQQLPQGLNLSFEAARSPQQAVSSLQVLLLMSVLAFVPALILMVTSFTRILIVLSLLRQAIGLPQIPPNQVIVALSIFLTIFVMRPQLSAINSAALEPYMKGKISHTEALRKAEPPLRQFMLAQTRRKDLQAFTSMSGVTDAAEVPLSVLIPSFITSELKTSFQIGFLLFIPFLLVDMIVASILMSMGMVMIPPAMISMPFKLLLFVLIDGWTLVLSGLAASFK